MRDTHISQQVRHAILYPAALAQALERIYRPQAHQSHQATHKFTSYMITLPFEIIHHLANAHCGALVILFVHELHHLQILCAFAFLALIVGCAPGDAQQLALARPAWQLMFLAILTCTVSCWGYQCFSGIGIPNCLYTRLQKSTSISNSPIFL